MKTNVQFKGIISDVDGTLMGPDKIIAESVSTAINALIDRGFVFSIASGRAYNELKINCASLHLTSPQIVRGGAEIIDPKTDKILFAEDLEPLDSKAVVELLAKNNIPFYVEKENLTFTTTPNPKYIHRIFRDLSELTYEEIPKIVLIATGMDIPKMELFVEEEISKKMPTVHAIKSYSKTHNVWDITSIKATKQLAVFHLAKLLGCKPMEFIGAGDGYNDFPLLEACGEKVVMGNGVDELKAIADYIAPSVEENGMAHIIEKYFFTSE